MEQVKSLQLTAEQRTYKDKTTGELKSFTALLVNVNGIVLQVKGTDRTSQAILEQYFGTATN